MRKLIIVTAAGAVASLTAAGAAFATVVPAPLLGAGPVGLTVLAVAGGAYFVVRSLRKGRD